MLHNLYVASSMVIANLMARSLTRNGKEIPTDVQKEVRQEIAREGKDLCQLEEDEIEQLYRKTQNHMRQIFANRMLRPAIGQFAKKITERRTLSAHDILEELESLHII
jgi:5-methylthioribose kinase